jgi:hypothetical protein
MTVPTLRPYKARDIRGIGFIIADQIAPKLGIPRTTMLRARAGTTWEDPDQHRRTRFGKTTINRLDAGRKLNSALEADLADLSRHGAAIVVTKASVSYKGSIVPFSSRPRCASIRACGSTKRPCRS